MADASLGQELFVLVTDKLVIGLVVLGVGYLASRSLERHKSNEALRKELERERIKVVAPLWIEINAIHYMVTMDYNLRIHGSSDEDLQRLKDQISEKETKAILGVRESQFWLGAELFQAQMAYFHKIRDLMQKLDELRQAHRTGQSGGSIIDEVKAASDAARGAFLDIDDVYKLLTRGRALT